MNSYIGLNLMFYNSCPLFLPLFLFPLEPQGLSHLPATGDPLAQTVCHTSGGRELNPPTGLVMLVREGTEVKGWTGQGHAEGLLRCVLGTSPASGLLLRQVLAVYPLARCSLSL